MEIGLGAVLFILIIIFIVLLLKLKKTAASRSRSKAVLKIETGHENHKGAGAIPIGAVPMATVQGGKTQLLPNPIAELLVERGSDMGMMFTVSKNASTIGRSGARLNDIVLTDNTVSKEQASLHFDLVNVRFSITNQSGKNQTKVNGIIVDNHVFLNDGELIEMGKTALRFKKL